MPIGDLVKVYFVYTNRLYIYTYMCIYLSFILAIVLDINKIGKKTRYKSTKIYHDHKASSNDTQYMYLQMNVHYIK